MWCSTWFYIGLGPLLFNIDICDLFFWDYKCDIASYADDNTMHISDRSLENIAHDLIRWFKENHMKVNPD